MTICHDIHVDILRSKHISQPIKLETRYLSAYVLHETLRKENKSQLYFAHFPPKVKNERKAELEDVTADGVGG